MFYGDEIIEMQRVLFGNYSIMRILNKGKHHIAIMGAILHLVLRFSFKKKHCYKFVGHRGNSVSNISSRASIESYDVIIGNGRYIVNCR